LLPAAFASALLFCLIASGSAGAHTISTGDGFSCAINHAGAVYCTGSNEFGQLGNGGGASSATPVQVTGIASGATAISSGQNLTCAIVSGAAKCWGESSNTPVQVSGLTSGVTAIDAGAGFACAVVSGAAKCWGANGDGQLGNGTTTPSATPVQVTGLTSGVTAVAAGASFACAVVSGAAKCWGWGEEGRLGNGGTTNSPAPAQVIGLTSGVTAISAGTFHACALASGSAKCWGSNSSGQLGDGHDSDEVGHAYDQSPVQVVGLTSGVTEISVGREFTCAIVSGAAKCWGAGGYAQLGNGGGPSNVAVQVTGQTSGVTSISAGYKFACSVVSGVVKCWGDNTYGALGNGASAIASSPIQVPSLTNGVTAVTAGQEYTCAVVSGAAKCWGDNSLGQLGNGTNTSSASPVQVTGLTSGVTAISAEIGFTCAVVSGAAKCWGQNGQGQLGNGVTGTGSNVPVQVTGLTSGVTSIAVGGEHACAIVSGAVKCWGDNGSGALLNGGGADSNVPVQATDLTTGVTSISASMTTCVVVSAAVKCGGYGFLGGVGDGTSNSSSVAVQTVGQSSGGISVSAGTFRSCAVMSGALNCWGVSLLSPLQVASLTSGVTAVSAGYAHICAIQSGAARCLGENEDGQLGNGSLADSNDTPVQASGLTSNVTAIAAGVDHTCAIKSAALHCWGSRYTGQLGDGMFAQEATPVSIPNFYPLGTPPPDTTNPVISNVSPVNNFSTTSASVSLTYTATDNSGAAPTCTPASGSTVALNLGSNSITISCHDAANNTAASTITVTRTVPPDTTAPVISNIAPVNGTSTANASITLTYTATDNSGAAPTCSPLSGSTVPLVLGANTITVNCADALNNQATASVTVTRTAVVTQPPDPGPSTSTGTDAGTGTVPAPITATKTLISGKPKLTSKKRSATVTYTCAKPSCTITLKIKVGKKRHSVKSKSLPTSSSDVPVKAVVAIKRSLAETILGAKKKRLKVTVTASIQ
jgi:alpha-tubulin suppressor-like RCC1 family protein